MDVFLGLVGNLFGWWLVGVCLGGYGELEVFGGYFI